MQHEDAEGIILNYSVYTFMSRLETHTTYLKSKMMAEVMPQISADILPT